LKRWRRWLRAIHRDIGYILTGLTVIYSISGIAVNHASDWNPNYIIEKKTIVLKLNNEDKSTTKSIVSAIMNKVGVDEKLKNSFRPDSNTIKVFTEKHNINYDLSSEELTTEEIKGRPILKESNYLHLNAPKRIWTYVADTFAFGLIFLAISGLFLIKGKNGMKWRGTWLTLAGILIPIIFLLIYYYY
jgi:uncharacterized protein